MPKSFKKHCTPLLVVHRNDSWLLLKVKVILNQGMPWARIVFLFNILLIGSNHFLIVTKTLNH